MVSPGAWVLNFDADEELARPNGHPPPRGLQARMPALVMQAKALLGPEDVLVALPLSGPYVGRAWCPTPRALRLLRAAGAHVLPSPAFDVLRRVNHRRFCAELGQTLPGARYVASRGELEAVLAGPDVTGFWLLKRPFGFAGRGRKRVQHALAACEEAWVGASFRDGDGLQVEPWVDRLGDFALHGYVTRAGVPFFGEPTTQECDRTGAWQRTTLASRDALSPDEERALRASAVEVAHALRDVGFFGPFGVDAFRWARGDGTSSFNTRSEINARYSMGWAVGMGPLRPDLDDRLAARSL